MLWSVNRVLLPFLFFLCSSVVLAQYGPMGIGNADGSPTSAGPQPRLLLWLDGSSVEPYTNQAPVDVWRDKSGNDQDFLPDGFYQPSLRNGLNAGPSGTFPGSPTTPCVRFENRDDQLLCSDFELSEEGYSIYFVIKTDDDDYGLFSYATISNDEEMLIYNDMGIGQKMDDPPVDRSSQIGNLLGNDDWNYGGITWSNNDADNWEFTRATEYQNGFGQFNGISIFGTGSAMIGEIQNSAGIPTFPDPPAPSNFEGDIAEIIVFEGRINRPATRLLRTYFWVKYGLDGASGGWDKYHGLMSSGIGNQWGGKYYRPIGIGNDIVTPNAGSINEARDEFGLVLRVNENEWTQTRSYICAAAVGNSISGLDVNQSITDDLTSIPSVERRWSRLWEIAGNNEGNGQIFQIGFDFGEGIEGGEIPQNPENFVLLYRDDPTTGDFEILNVPNSDKFVLDDEIVFRVPKSSLLTPGRYFTVGTTDNGSSSLTGTIQRTWYAYESGNWNDPDTWTVDGSSAPSYVNPGNDIPNVNDDIFIGAGRNVTVDMTLPTQGDLRVFGTLDFASTPQASFTTIGGSGLIRCSAGNFPTGVSSAFADPEFGGTLEFYGSGGFSISNDIEVNKLKINLLSTGSITLIADLTTNGLFEVNSGTLIVNNTANVSRTITTNGQVLVESEGIIRVSDDTGLIRHKWFFYDDLINNGGEVKFTNRTVGGSSAYINQESNHIIEAFFVSSNQNQKLVANGESFFSRMVIDKGSDETYILTISSNGPDKFKLLGRCRTNLGPFQQQFVDESINQNSFALINGTAEIRQNIFIPLFINNGIYNINNTAQIWVNGGEVTYGPFGAGGNSGALVLYGIIKVTDGVFNVFNNNGIVIRANGLVQVDGEEAQLNTNQIRTSLLGPTNIGGLIINDGEVNINGNRPEGSLNTYYTLSLTYPGNLFRMTGGELNITGPTNLGLVFINSDPQNTSVTGGDVNLDVSDTQDRYRISSRAAFWNLNLTRSSTSAQRNFKVIGGNSGPDSNLATIQQQDLIIRNMLTLSGPNTPKIEMGTESEPADLFLYGNLEIDDGCEYIHNRNTTHFVGSSTSSLTFGGSTAFPFHNVVVDKDLDSRKVNIQQTGPNPSMDILGTLSLENGYFDNNDRNVEIRGNVINRTQFGDSESTGILNMRGNSGRQEILSDNGIFHRLRIDNPDGVSLTNGDVTLKKELKLDDGSFFIGNHKLRIESTNTDQVENWGTDRLVICSGNASAGGLELLNHSSTQTLFYPIGVSDGENLKFTWAEIEVNSSWTDDGFIGVTPVDTLLSTADLSGSPDYLNFYWKVSSKGYDSKPNVSHIFRYREEDIRGNELNFESGRVLSTLPFTRDIDNETPAVHVSTSNNRIYYNGSDVAQDNTGNGTLLVDANYSAGAADRLLTGSSPDIYFSRNSVAGAAWNVDNNWTEISDCTSCSDIYDYHSQGNGPSSDYPKEGDIAVIGFDVNNPYRPHVYEAPPGGIEAAQVVFTPLQDQSDPPLRQPRYNGPNPADLGILRPTLKISSTSDIIKVAQISGEGAIMIDGDVDLGVTDLGGFLNEDSSVVVINNSSLTETAFNFLPSTLPNLFIANANATLTSDIRVRGNLEIAGQSQLKLSESSDGNIEVNGNLILDQYQSTTGNPSILYNRRGVLKTIDVEKDIKLLGSSAYIGVAAASGPPPEPVEWTPDEIDAFIWLDATQGVTQSGGLVTEWQDQASGTYIATQSDVNKMPTYQVGMNGLNTLRFDGIDDFLAIPHSNELNILSNEDFEIFSVAQFDDPVGSTPSEFSIIFGKGVINSRDFLLYLALSKYRVYMDQNRMGIVAPSNHTTASNLGWVRRQGNNGELYNTVGGTNSKGNVANASMSGNTHNVTIGAAEDGTDRFMEGDISEIILIRRALTNEERQLMEGYLAHKWGLQDELPAGHPFRDEAPTVGGLVDNTARLSVKGDIIQNLSNTSSVQNGMELFETSTDTAFVNLVVEGNGNNSFNNSNGPAPRLWKLRVDKGINTNSSFTFDSNVIIGGLSNESEKPVELRNGLAIFDDPNIDVTLASGGGDYFIPSAAGIELNNGTLRINGNEIGLSISGRLNITGGTFNIGDTEGENNYIEYGGGSSPKIDISGGTLLVGSQIRRNLSSLGGSLDYRQSGGDVIIGRYSAPAASRGMLEVLNSGSRFDHTGGTLTFVRSISSSTIPSLLLLPDNSNVSSASEIVIGNADSPSGAEIQNFSIESGIPLNSLTISSNNDPVVNLITIDLQLNGDLTIGAGATLNSDERNLTIRGDLSNDGLLNFETGSLNLDHPVSGTVSGAGIFNLYDLARQGGIAGVTQVNTSLLVENSFANDKGEMNFEGSSSNTLTVEGNVVTDGVLKFDSASDGLILEGDEEQILTRTEDGESEIDVLTINNENGVTISDEFSELKFKINENLRLEKGVFSLSGNLLEMETGAIFTAVNPFSENNMIVTGGTFANYGLLMNIPANTTDDIFIPLGIERYMPINLDFSQGSSGTTASSYLLRLNVPECGVVVNDPMTPFNELNNVLGMFFSVDGNNIGDDLNMDLKLRYNQQYVQVTNPYTEEDYIAARVLADETTISKLGPGAVDDVNDILTFNLQGSFAGDQFAVDGDYFAGIDEAIPNTIPVYETVNSVNQVWDGANDFDPPVPGGGPPTGALVIVRAGHTLKFEDDDETNAPTIIPYDGINFYRTVIENGAKIDIDETTQHRLGRVSGNVTGTGSILVRGSGILPSGDYTEFFGCGGGKLEFQSKNLQSFEILSNMPPIEGVTLRGPGELIIANSSVNICSDFNITGSASVIAANSSLLTVGGNTEINSGSINFRQGNALLEGDFVITESPGPFFPLLGSASSGNNGTLTIGGNFELGGNGINLGTVFRETHLEGNLEKLSNPSSGSIQDGTGGAKLILDGIVPQTITGEFTGNSDIPTLELNNGTGLTIDGNVEISEKLILTDGNIFTDDSKVVRLTSDAVQVEPIGGQPNSFVDGPMQWELGATSAEKKFPIGTNDRYRPLTVSNRSAARTWEAEYFDTLATVETDITSLLPDPLNIPAIETVSIQEYWRVVTSGGALPNDTEANIGLSWGENSAVSTSTTEQSNLVVLAYDESNNEWDSYGGDGFDSPPPFTTGSLVSDNPISFSERFFTLGSSDGLGNPLPVSWLYFDGENKDKDNVLTWATASEQNNEYFELGRSIDANNWTKIAEIEGAGQSSTTLTYTYTDKNAPFGLVYYRLKQVDFDGKQDFAPNLVSLNREFDAGNFDFLLFPNPSKIGTVRFRMSSNFDVRANVMISDMSGKMLSQGYVQIDGQGTSAPLDCNFEPGIYLVTVIVNDKLRSKPLVITR